MEKWGGDHENLRIMRLKLELKERREQEKISEGKKNLLTLYVFLFANKENFKMTQLSLLQSVK